jgi:hypothetical protein
MNDESTQQRVSTRDMDAKRAQGAGSLGAATDESGTKEDRSGEFEIFEISIDGMCGVY